jgi:hypothetical protein
MHLSYLGRPAPSRLRRLAAAVLIAAGVTSGGLLTSASAAPSAGPDRATFGVAPATIGKTDVRPYFSFQIGAGGSYSDRVALVNFAAKPVDLIVFAADLANAGDGGLTVGLQAAKAIDAGGWVKLPIKAQTVHVPAGRSTGPGRVELPFTIQVPVNASPGDHGAAIVATLSTLGRNPQGQNVRLDQRVATRIYLRVSGAAAPRLAIENLRTTYHATANPFGAGRTTVSYTVHNTGNIKLGASQTVSVTGLFGTRAAAKAPADLGLLFPGASVSVTVEVSGVVPTGLQKAYVTAVPLVIADDSATIHATSATATISFFAAPWPQLATVVILIGLFGLALWYRHKRRRRPDGRGRHSGKLSPNAAVTERVSS